MKLSEAARSPAIGAVVKVEELERGMRARGLHKQVCQTHVGMDEAEAVAGLSVGCHDLPNARLRLSEGAHVLPGQARERPPVAPRRARSKGSGAIP